MTGEDIIRLENGHYVRLIGINTPEAVDPSKRPASPGGDMATEELGKGLRRDPSMISRLCRDYEGEQDREPLAVRIDTQREAGAYSVV